MLMPRTRYGHFAAFALAVGAAADTAAAQDDPTASIRVDDTFEDFAEGQLDAAGQNLYVSHDGSVRTIRRYDLDGDGYLDLVFNNTHDLDFEQNAELAAYDSERQPTRRSLPVGPTERVLAKDLNGDGRIDLVFQPSYAGLQDVWQPLSIVWSALDTPANAPDVQVLRTVNPSSIAAADFDADGLSDLAVLDKSADAEGQTLRVFWQQAEGFAQPGLTAIDVAPSLFAAAAQDLLVVLSEQDVAVYAFDQDRKPRVIFRQGFDFVPRAWVMAEMKSGEAEQLLIVDDRQRLHRLSIGNDGGTFEPPLPFVDATHLTASDLDRDGFSDLVVTNVESGRALGGELAGSEAGTGVGIFWGGEDGPSTENAARLDVEHAIATDAGDLDGDGQGDIAVAVYQGEETFAAESRVFWGEGSRRFTPDTRPIVTHGAKGVTIVQKGAVAWCNAMDGTVGERVPLQVFWGGPDVFSPQRQTRVLFRSGNHSVVADLNADGWNELVALNSGHDNDPTDPTLGVNIFWGSANGFDWESKPTILRELTAGTLNVADLNADGYLDIIVGEFERDDPPSGMAIYYGSAEGFAPAHRVHLPSRAGALNNIVADFNRDGSLDIAVTRISENRAVIYLGQDGGFSEESTWSIPAPGALDLEAADLNADGKLDLIVGSYFDPTTRSHDAGVRVFWGQEGGYDPRSSQWLPGSTVIGSTVADFDRDGYLDLFGPSYHADGTRQGLPCRLYWGSAHGFRADLHTELRADSGHDALAADFDRDGLIDLAISCHTRDHSHHTDSLVYLNDGQRFAEPRTIRLPTSGTHWMYLHDMGHIADRGWRQVFTGTPLQSDRPASRLRVVADAEAPAFSKVQLQARTAETRDQLASAAWQDLPENGEIEPFANDRFAQYRVVFVSENGSSYPLLKKVVMNWLPNGSP